MSGSVSRLPTRRPVIIADYTPSIPATGEAKVLNFSPQDEQATPQNNAIRYNFPPAGETLAGGVSDGYCYRVTFAAGRLERSFVMVQAFLTEHGYGEVPVPQNAEELRRFRLPPKLRHQLSLFGDNGYVHNPIKILFPVPAGRQGALVLELYNEASTDHLLRFHRLK